MLATAPENVTTWWWVRHAPVTGYEGKVYGAMDVPADTSDVEAYQDLAKNLPKDAFWLSSHLSRTHATAHAIGLGGLAHDTPQVEQGLGEQNFGIWQEMTYAEQKADWCNKYGEESLHKFWYCPADYAPEDGESFVDVIARVKEVIDRMTIAHRGRNIVAVAHGGVIRAALSIALELDPEKAFAFQTENLSTTRIEHLNGPGQGGNWRVAFVNKRAGTKPLARRQIA